MQRTVRHGDHVVVRPSGVVVGSARYPASREDNRLLVTGPADARQIAVDARPLVQVAEPAVTLFGPAAAGAARRLSADGWSMGSNRVLALQLALVPASWSAAEELARTTEVPPARTADLARAIWAEEIADAAVVDQLVDREVRTAAAARTVARAVVDDDVVVASGQLRIQGGTAFVESVQTLPGARRRGAGDAVLAGLVATAQRARCDLVLLEADADDWPRHWYTRRGFHDVGAVHHGHRPDGKPRDV